MMGKLFGTAQPPPAPPPKTLNQMSKEELKDKQREMQKNLNKEMREIDRQNMQIEMARKKSEAELQKEIKKGAKADKFIKQTYAKQIITCQKNKERNLVNKGQVQNLTYSLDNMFANIRMAQTMGQASNVMKEVNKCMNIKELSATMQEMQKEMMKMGLVAESMDEAMENMNSDADIGDLQEEADKLIFDMEKQISGGQKNLPQQQQQATNIQNNPDLDDLDKRLQEL